VRDDSRPSVRGTVVVAEGRTTAVQGEHVPGERGHVAVREGERTLPDEKRIQRDPLIIDDRCEPEVGREKRVRLLLEGIVLADQPQVGNTPGAREPLGQVVAVPLALVDPLGVLVDPIGKVGMETALEVTATSSLLEPDTSLEVTSLGSVTE
jgi:hypothetical protein